MAAIQSSIFPGFSSGKQICDVLRDKRHEDLKEFTKQLFFQVHLSHRSLQQTPTNQEEFLDSLALLLTGDETCAAVALSGGSLLIATNKGDHNRDTVSMLMKYKILDISQFYQKFRLGAKCQIITEANETKEIPSEPITFQFVPNQMVFKIIEGPHRLTFVFTQNMFKTIVLPEDLIISFALHSTEDVAFWSQFFLMENKEEFAFDKPVVMSIGPLQRRATKIINWLAFVTQTIITRGAWSADKTQEQVRFFCNFVEREYYQYVATKKNRSEDDFIDSIRDKSQKEFPFLSKEGHENFLREAKRHYLALDLADRAEDYFESKSRWPMILSETLTYELSNQGVYKRDISLQIGNVKNQGTMIQLYERLVKDYQEFKQLNESLSDVSSMKRWFQTIPDRFSDENLEFPQFIMKNRLKFIKIARRHFVALAKIERYVKNDALKDGPLSLILRKENIFSKSRTVDLISGENDIHAEMRLFNRHLMKNAPLSDYYGIAKLCCVLCHYTLQQFKLPGVRIAPNTRGSHGVLFDKWKLLDALKKDEYLSVFLQKDLFQKYCELKQKDPRRLESLKKGPFYKLNEVALSIINRLASLNNPNGLAALNLDKSFLIEGSKNLYPIT